jgi:hypothetical protein
MTSPFLDDLRFAQQARRAVEVGTYSGRHFQACGVWEVDPEDGWVLLHTPTSMGDTTTRTRIDAADIASVTVTDIEWFSEGDQPT